MTKKISTALIIGAMTMSFSSCGYAAPGHVASNEQTTVNTNDGLLGSLLGQKGNTGDIISMIKGALIPSESQIVGTWGYQRPAIAFTSENALASIGSNMVSSSIENKLQSYLGKLGLNTKNTSVTFNKDKTFTFNINGRQLTGTYTVADKTIQMTFKGQKAPCRLTPQLNNGTLIIAADATKLKSFLESIGTSANRGDINTIVALMKQFNGMQVGIRLQKK